jgi:ABC-2 type transport system ATP-binding protein
MSATILQFSKACHAFGDRQALKDISLSIDTGEIVALLGPNGAGKTTLIRAASGRIRLDSGSVRVAGLNPASNPVARRALGIVPQTIALYPQLSARQNLDVFARLMGLTGRAVGQAVDQALECVSLQHRADDLLTQLSGGMQRRLNIVAGTLHRPKLLLLDEPTVGVDLQARESIQALLQTLCNNGMGIIVSTHDFEQAASMADRAVFMARGCLLLEGKVEELIAGIFGNAKEGIVSLAQPASPSALAILKNFKLQSREGNQLWSGALQGGYTELAQLEWQLETVGAHVAEIRLRDPGLTGVFLHTMHENTAS